MLLVKTQNSGEDKFLIEEVPKGYEKLIFGNSSSL